MEDYDVRWQLGALFGVMYVKATCDDGWEDFLGKSSGFVFRSKRKEGNYGSPRGYSFGWVAGDSYNFLVIGSLE